MKGGFRQRLIEAADVLLGRSAYQEMAPGTESLPTLDSPEVEEQRRRMGGQLSLPTTSQTRWYLADLEMAELRADAGDMGPAARLMTAARKDGIMSGVLSTRTEGLVRLPRKFRGDADVVAALELGHDRVISVFDEMCPATELAHFAADGCMLGVAIGELVPVAGRDYPVFVRHSPEFLFYRWVENRWYFKSIAGLLPITPGDGRWVLHLSGGRMAPWQHGLWRSLGRAYIRKEHAAMHKDNWEAKLANPARVAVAPQGAAEQQAEAWFRSVMAWGINTVFGMRPGYDVKLIESNGRGWDSFNKTIADQNTEMTIAIAGQTVTTDGGAGFQNSDIHKTIRADLIKATADQLAFTINTQIIPPFIALRFGAENVVPKATVVEWDVTPPKDRNSEATSLVTVASAVKVLTEALQPYGVQLDVTAITSRFSVPIQGDVNGDGRPDAGGLTSSPDVPRDVKPPQLRAVEPNPDDVDPDGDVEIDQEAA